MNLTFVPNALEKISPTWVMSDITYPDGIINPHRGRLPSPHRQHLQGYFFPWPRLSCLV